MIYPNNVLVTGAGGPAGKGAIQVLKEKGFHVVAVDMAPVEHQADAFFLVPPAQDPDFTACLEALLVRQEISWLFPTVQEELVPLSRLAADYRRRRISVFISDPEAVSICHDKWLTAQALAAAGLPVPASAIGAATAPEVVALGYPRISKPRVGRGGRHVMVHDTPGQAAAGEDLLWQTFMPGTEYDVLLMIAPAVPARVLSSVVFEKTALREGRTGNACQLKRVKADDVRRLALAAARALNLVGPIDMDIRRDADGVARVLEINARIGAHTHQAPEIFDALVELYKET
jgi:carbamoyl-phosphate synthase large subunit